MNPKEKVTHLYPALAAREAPRLGSALDLLSATQQTTSVSTLVCCASEHGSQETEGGGERGDGRGGVRVACEGYSSAMYWYLLVPSSAQSDARIRCEACQGIVHHALPRVHLVCCVHRRVVAHLVWRHRDGHVVRQGHLVLSVLLLHMVKRSHARERRLVRSVGVNMGNCLRSICVLRTRGHARRRIWTRGGIVHGRCLARCRWARWLLRMGHGRGH